MACQKGLVSTSGLMDHPTREISSRDSAVDMEYGKLIEIVLRVIADTTTLIARQDMESISGTTVGNTRVTSIMTTATDMVSYMIQKDSYSTKAFGKMVSSQTGKHRLAENNK